MKHSREGNDLTYTYVTCVITSHERFLHDILTFKLNLDAATRIGISHRRHLDFNHAHAFTKPLCILIRLIAAAELRQFVEALWVRYDNVS